MGTGHGPYFGHFGGRFVPEVFMPLLLELEAAMEEIIPTAAFQNSLDSLLHGYAGRATALSHCPRLSAELGFDLWLKREDLLHTGAHKLNNTLGQALLAKEMGKQALIAESSSGQHGVATAAAAARLGLDCTIFMGSEDAQAQEASVRHIRLLGATLKVLDSDERGVKEAINAALRYWLSTSKTSHYCLGSAVGPHPFPVLVREFQSIIGKECRAQCLKNMGRLPDVVVACVGGGSNAMGIFDAFLDDLSVRLVGVEGAGSGEPGRFNAASLNMGSVGILHGARTLLLQNNDGQVEPSQSIAPGLDYPAVGPELAYLKETGRAHFGMVKDANVLAAVEKLCRCEGILPALESAHALAWVLDHPQEFEQGSQVVVNLSGRGDKDLPVISAALARKEA